MTTPADHAATLRDAIYTSMASSQREDALAALAALQVQAEHAQQALRAYHDLMPALADCANECGEALLYSEAHKANEIAHAALTEDSQ